MSLSVLCSVLFTWRVLRAAAVGTSPSPLGLLARLFCSLSMLLVRRSVSSVRPPCPRGSLCCAHPSQLPQRAVARASSRAVPALASSSPRLAPSPMAFSFTTHMDSGNSSSTSLLSDACLMLFTAAEANNSTSTKSTSHRKTHKAKSEEHFPGGVNT